MEKIQAKLISKQITPVVQYAIRNRFGSHFHVGMRNANIPERIEELGRAYCDVDKGRMTWSVDNEKIPLCVADCAKAHELSHVEFDKAQCAKLVAAYKTANEAAAKVEKSKSEDDLREAKRKSEDFERAVESYAKWEQETCRENERLAYEAGITECNKDEVRKTCEDTNETARYNKLMEDWNKYRDNPPNCLAAVPKPPEKKEPEKKEPKKEKGEAPKTTEPKKLYESSQGAVMHESFLQRKPSCGGSAEHSGKSERHSEKMKPKWKTDGPCERVVQLSVHDVLRSPGQFLDNGLWKFMEKRFGHDFSRVRVHTDVKAGESASAMNALAYTVGRDIVFGTGQYEPGTSSGRRLLAHELMHVVQQTAMPRRQKIDGQHLFPQFNLALGEALFRKPEPGKDEVQPPIKQQSSGLATDKATGQDAGTKDNVKKDGGASGLQGTAHWLDPVINQRNFAEVQFRSTGLSGTGGLTTHFVNEREIKSNQDVENAIPQPPVESRAEGGTTFCWFSRGVDVTARTTMDIFIPGPWNYTVSREEVAKRYPWKESCKNGTGPSTIHIDARPNDKAMETFVRLGEAEHDTDSKRSFEKNLAVYVNNVNAHIGDTPQTRVAGPNPAVCMSNLRRLENRDLLTQFVVDLNASANIRHANGRHSIAHVGLTFNKNCSLVTEIMEAGSL